jgi:hypothetical protein
VNGNILIAGNVLCYNKKTVNEIVEETIRQFGIYCKEYEPNFHLTRYARSFTDGNFESVLQKTPWRGDVDSEFRGRHQPFITVFDRPEKLSERLCGDLRNVPLREDLYLIIGVSSGSHVSFMDTPYAQEIHDVTMKLYEILLQRKKEILPEYKNFAVLFDDEHNFLGPDQFSELVGALSTIN